MRGIAFSLSVILLIGLLAIIIGILAYKIRLRKVEKGEIRGTHSAIPAPEATVNGIYKLVLMLVAVLCLLNISVLLGEIRDIRRQLLVLPSANEQIAELRDLLEREDSRILTFGYEFGDVNYEERTCSVTLDVTLKTSRDDTAVSLDLGESRVALKEDAAGHYTATFDYGLFEPYSDALLYISEAGSTTAEIVDFPSPLFYEYLPMHSVAYTWSSWGTMFGKFTYEGEFVISTPHLDDIASVSLTYMTSNRDLKTVDITQQALSGEAITLEQGLGVEKDLATRIEIVTKSGFTIVQQDLIVYDGSLDTDVMQFTEIRDKSGQTLWREDY